MDPLTIASSVIGILTPIIANGVGEVANTDFKDVYASIKEKLSRNPEEGKIIEQFEKDPSRGADAFQALLIEHISIDQELMKQLIEALQIPKTRSSLVGKVEAKNVVIADKIDKIDMS